MAKGDEKRYKEYCSFCHKSEDEVGMMLNGDDVNICNECVEFCYSLIKENRQTVSEKEKVKKYEFVSDEWSMATGVMTPTLKVKRKVVMLRYRDLIDKMFAQKE